MPAATRTGLVTISGVHVGVLTSIAVSFPSNSAAGTVHVRSVELVDPSPGVHMQGTAAFRVQGLPGLPPSGQEDFGTRSPGCPKNYLGPRPVTAITLAPHKTGHWIAQILFTVSAPGTYHFGKAKIFYTVGGVRTWQYESLGLAIRYDDPPHCRRLATTLSRNEDRMVQTPLSKPSPGGVWERDKQLPIHVLRGQLRVGPIRICG
jgi:hypothetical protein